MPTRFPPLAFFLLALSILPLTSCALAVGAAIGAGAVHATSEDTVELVIRARDAEVVSAAEGALDALGAAELVDRERVILQGSVGESRVDIRLVDGVERRTVEISARRHAGLSPDLETARAVAREIALRLD